MSVLVGRRAPDFTAPAVLGDGTLVDEYRFADAIRNKYAILFFYPGDFTFVCPSELIALNNRLDEFRRRQVEVVGASVDSAYAHNAWRRTPVDKGGIGPLRYTLVADMTHAVSRAYDVETPDGKVAYRGSFLIDRGGVVRHQVVNDLPIGRDIEDLLRTVDALQFFEAHGEVCPAGWRKGQEAMEATPEGVSRYLKEHAAQL